MNERVSVVIPCYNGENTIDRAVASVFSQGYADIEVIVVDDGSTDNSKYRILAWQEKFASADLVLRYVYQENQGLGSAINTGLKQVTGSYLTLLDADDEYLPGAIEERAAYLQEHPECDVVRSNGWIIKGDHRRLFVYSDAEKQCADVFTALLRGETNNWAGSYMIRTEPLFRFYPDRDIYTSRYGQNLQLLLPVTYHKSCGFIDKPMMNYIQQANSLSQTADSALAKKRSLENAAGYRDIRVYMLKLIVKDSSEQQRYLRLIDGAYWRNILQLAADQQDRKLLLESFVKLKREEVPTLQDRITYYRQIFPPVALLLRAWNKLRQMMDI